MIEYTLIRSARKTLAIEIGSDGRLVVRAPMRTPKYRIEAFLREKEGWILPRMAKARERLQQTQNGLRRGSVLPLLGQQVTVIPYSGRHTLLYRGNLLLPAAAPEKAFVAWRLQLAQSILLPRVAYWENRTGLKCQSIRFGNADTRWGSMTTQHALRLNTALLHLTPAQIDYVIVHELCHIPHPDHSPAFHASVRSFLPDADQLRQQIRKSGPPCHPQKIHAPAEPE